MSRLHGELAKIFYGIESYSTRCSPAATILIVEENAMARASAACAVEAAGYSFVIAAAQGAMDALLAQPLISALLISADMPAIDGFELAAETRRLHPDLGILIASGRAVPPQKYLPERAVFVRKPYAVSTLTMALATLGTEAGNVRTGAL